MKQFDQKPARHLDLDAIRFDVDATKVGTIIGREQEP